MDEYSYQTDDEIPSTGGTIDPNTYLKHYKQGYSSNPHNTGSYWVFAPKITSEDYPDGLTTKESLITAFYNQCHLWIISFAEDLINKPGSGFAILAIINAYFEMIAQLQGKYAPPARLRKKGDLYHSQVYVFGIKEVFKEEVRQAPDKVFDLLYHNVRNSTAHMMLTGEDVILQEQDKPITWEVDALGNVISIQINPRLWVSSIRNHLEEYVSDLKKEDTLYQLFEARFRNRGKPQNRP